MLWQHGHVALKRTLAHCFCVCSVFVTLFLGCRNMLGLKIILIVLPQFGGHLFFAELSHPGCGSLSVLWCSLVVARIVYMLNA